MLPNVFIKYKMNKVNNKIITNIRIYIEKCMYNPYFKNFS